MEQGTIRGSNKQRHQETDQGTVRNNKKHLEGTVNRGMKEESDGDHAEGTRIRRGSREKLGDRSG